MWLPAPSQGSDNLGALPTIDQNHALGNAANDEAREAGRRQ
jgi:hypothetical protein